MLGFASCSKDEEALESPTRVVASAALTDAQDGGSKTYDDALSETSAPGLSDHGWLVFDDTTHYYTVLNAIADASAEKTIYHDEFWASIDAQLSTGHNSLRAVYRATAEKYELNVASASDIGVRSPSALTLIDEEHAAVQIADSVYF